MAKENPDSVNHLGGTDDDDVGLIASSLSDGVDADRVTQSVSVDVTRVGGTQPIPITLSLAAAHDGISYQTDSGLQTTGGPPSLTLAPLPDTRKPGSSFNAELSSDAEYYTPVGTPDESRQLLAATTVHVDDLTAASELTAAIVGKVINCRIQQTEIETNVHCAHTQIVS